MLNVSRLSRVLVEHDPGVLFRAHIITSYVSDVRDGRAHVMSSARSPRASSKLTRRFPVGHEPARRRTSLADPFPLCHNGADMAEGLMMARFSSTNVQYSQIWASVVQTSTCVRTVGLGYMRSSK